MIVLAFLLLLTTITVAFLSRSTLERQLSNASFSQGKTDLAAQGAITAIIGDLQQEVVAGSNVGQGTTIPTLSAGYYYPNSPITVVPSLVVPGYTSSSIVGTGLENLVKISKNGSAFYTGTAYVSTGPTRASAVNSASDVSLNNRSVTKARWNAPLLLTKATPGSETDWTPVSAFTAPDWIYVARDGSNPTAWDTMYRSKTGVSLTTAASSGNPGTNPVTQRYAYAIYDEGGIFDLNVAGNPVTGTSGVPATVTYSAMQPYKNALAYADLTQLPYLSTTAQTVAGATSSTLTAAQQKIVINAIVGWRNLYSAQVIAGGGKFPGSAAATAYTFPTTTAAANVTSTLYPAGSSLSPFDLNTLFNPFGYLSTGGILGKTTGASVIKNYNNNGNEFVANSTDNAFTSRQQLIQFFTQGLGQNNNGATSFVSTVVPSPSSVTTLAMLQNVLQYVGNFSRDISQPSYAPNPAKVTNAPILSLAQGGNDEGGLGTAGGGTYDNTLNPAFLNVTATSAFTRNDGTKAVVGEALAKKRFALMRLAWLTYKGPSAGRTIPSSNPGAGTANYDIWLLVNTYGIPATFLAQGTAANIYKYFGLSWISDTRQDVNGNNMDSGQTSKWVYNHTSANPAMGVATSPITSLPAHPASRNASGTAPYNTIYTLSQVAAAGRDPDFVELLKAAVCAGSIGKGCTNTAYQLGLDQSVDTQIIQMAANIIAQYKTDCYAPCILFDDGNWPTMAQEYRGLEDMPYVYRMRSLVFPLRDSTPPASYKPAVSLDNDGSASNPIQPGDTYAPPPAQPTNTAMTDSGIGVALNAVEIWNPHSWNTANATIGPRPTQFRLIAIAAPPTVAAPPATLDPNQVTMEGYVRSVNTPLTSGSTSTVLPTNMTHSISLTANGTALYFTIPTTRLDLFREPTLMIKPGIPQGSLLHFGGDPKGPISASVTEGKNQVFNTVPEASGGESLIQSYFGTDLTSGYKGLLTTTNGDYPGGYTNNSLFLGIYMGSFPIRWSNGTRIIGANCSVVSPGTSLTYRLQYQDPNNNWITYDEKYCNVTNGSRALNSDVPGHQAKSPHYIAWKLMGNNSDGANVEFLDPRTSRFGPLNNNYNYNTGGDVMGGWSQVPSALVASQSNATWGVRLDESASSYIRGFTSGVAGWYPGWSPASGSSTVYPGLYCQNNLAMTAPLTQFFADADGIVRRGMSGYVQPTTTQPAVTRPGGTASFTSPTAASGLPTSVAMDYSNAAASGTTPGSSTGTGAVQVNNGMEAPSRPIILNRPFRSVAELGYVFSGTPWRNLDMMTPESGNAALLDVFCINDTNDTNGLVAGKVDLNTRQAPVLQAILSGAYKNEFSPTTTTIAGSGTSPVAAANVIAAGLVTRTTSTTAPGGPLANISELVGKYNSNVTATVGTSPSTATFIDGSQTYTGFSGTQAPLTTGTIPSTPANLSSILAADIAAAGLPNNYDCANVERYREATIRALSNTTTARVWNLMIDVIAQTGRFPSSASTLANFNVEGERRYWVHVAIDRYTGKVLDQQIEEVKE